MKPGISSFKSIYKGQSPSSAFAVKADCFFDRDGIRKKLGDAKIAALSRCGALARRAARQSIRRRKQASKPGQPPTNRTGKLKDGIVYAYDAASDSVVVGPVKLGRGEAPGLLERGGTQERVKNLRRTKRIIGQSGEIRLGVPIGLNTKQIVDFRGAQQTVTYARLQTADQAQRANQINEALYGPQTIQRVPIAARPYMQPALESESRHFPEQFRNQFR